ncbi:MAG: Serine/threonine-protein kinase AfsK [Verrucomicrobiota bacterium]|jgi:serine/threonine protein kinase
MSCLTAERLEEIAAGLAPEAGEHEHLDACPECASALADLRLDEELIGELRGDLRDNDLRFGPYRFCRELTSGGMSIVYLGQAPDGSGVVIKACRQPRMLPSFRTELETLSRCTRLGLAGVVRLIDADLEHRPPYLVTEFHACGSLAERLQTLGPMPLAELAPLALDLAATLAALEKEGIVHGDLKLANILMRRDGRACLADLGSARSAKAQETLPLAAALSLVCVSPEQARGEAPLPASDVFSFGLLVHELASGLHPFAGKSSWETIANILNQPPRLSDALPSGIRSLISRCLAKNPAERPDFAAIAALSSGELLADRLSNEELRQAAASSSLGIRQDQPGELPELQTRNLILIASLTTLLLAGIPVLVGSLKTEAAPHLGAAAPRETLLARIDAALLPESPLRRCDRKLPILLCTPQGLSPDQLESRLATLRPALLRAQVVLAMPAADFQRLRDPETRSRAGLISPAALSSLGIEGPKEAMPFLLLPGDKADFTPIDPARLDAAIPPAREIDGPLP